LLLKKKKKVDNEYGGVNLYHRRAGSRSSVLHQRITNNLTFTDAIGAFLSARYLFYRAEINEVSRAHHALPRPFIASPPLGCVPVA